MRSLRKFGITFFIVIKLLTWLMIGSLYLRTVENQSKLSDLVREISETDGSPAAVGATTAKAFSHSRMYAGQIRSDWGCWLTVNFVEDIFFVVYFLRTQRRSN
jgi:hypothetical protein